MNIRAYILAGGKSSRMGRDKAMLEIGGQTLLARAVGTLRGVAALGICGGDIVVTVCGERTELEGADRAIADRYTACGPLGGMEAALNDLENSRETDWAFFFPVDMPLITTSTLQGLLTEWKIAIGERPSVCACFVEVEGRAQPLISLLHLRLHPRAKEALESGHFKVVPFLERSETFRSQRDGTTPFPNAGAVLPESYPQFTNVNTETDLMNVTTFIRHLGSNT